MVNESGSWGLVRRRKVGIRSGDSSDSSNDKWLKIYKHCIPNKSASSAAFLEGRMRSPQPVVMA